MKSILITFDQAHYESIVTLLEKSNCRGFTAWNEVQGRGSRSGTHAWPSLASAIITIVEDHRVKTLLDALKAMDDESPKLGLRAFVWNIEASI